jgi:hypothetical protein
MRDDSGVSELVVFDLAQRVLTLGHEWFCPLRGSLRELGEVEDVGVQTQDSITQCAQSAKASLNRNDLRVSDCVRRARKQVSEANLMPDAARKHAHRDVKCARNIAQDGRE